MSRSLACAITAVVLASSAWTQSTPAGFALVEGGSFQRPGGVVTIADFLLGKHEVTQKEWVDVMGSNPSEFKGDDLPVEMVRWYEAIEYCNRRSEKEGLQPYYSIDKTTPDPHNQNVVDDYKWTITINAGANGYRLPTEAEWEYAARGGRLSQCRKYSGSDDLADVGWFWQNSGDQSLQGMWHWPALEKNRNRTQPVGRKAPNELGLHDMSGNVREWCWDWFEDAASGVPSGVLRVWKGGGWMGGDFCCEPSFRAGFEPNSMGYDQGFRVCRGI